MSIKEIETEERKQEDVMKRFRSRDCNVLVATSVLEDGIDVPACHLVVRYDLPQSFRAYIHSKARARAKKAHYILMVENNCINKFLEDLSYFHATEQILLFKSGYYNTLNDASSGLTEVELDALQAPYVSCENSKVCASLTNAVSIINRYDASVPASDR